MKSIIFCLISLLAINPAVARGANSLSLGSVSVPHTQRSVSMPVNISASEIFAGFQIEISYNPDILLCRGAQAGNVVHNFNVLNNLENTGSIKSAGFDPSLNGISGAGVLIHLEFEIIGSGTSTLTFTKVSLSDSHGGDLPVNASSGTIKVEDDRYSEPPDEAGQETRPAEPSSPPQRDTQYRDGVPVTMPMQAPPNERERRESMRQRVAESRGLEDRQKIEDRRSTAVSIPAPPPSTAPNLMVFVHSEYGTPYPPRGITTYSRGEKITASVEKEVIISEMEKAVSKGLKGEGSVSQAAGNRKVFEITDDTKILWQWDIVPAEEGFTVELESDIDISLLRPDNKIEIYLKTMHYGGLKEPIELQVTTTPPFVDALFRKDSIEYGEDSAVLLLQQTEDTTAGNYYIEFIAACGGIKKDYKISFTIEGVIGQSVSIEDDRLLLTLKTVENLNKLGSFQARIHFPPNLLEMDTVSPDTIKYKPAGRNILALAGNTEKDTITVSFKLKRPSDNIQVKTDSFTLRNSEGKAIPTKIIELKN